MKSLQLFLLLVYLFVLSAPLFSQGVVIDHSCTDVSKIPDAWINQVKSLIKLHYAHTSHGGQLTTGIARLANPSLPVYDSRLMYTLQYCSLPSASDLCIMDGQLSQTYITPELYWKDGGDSYTRGSLNTYPAINVSMWSWCTQVDSYSETQVNDYLNTMSLLEQAYPDVTFVYMTGNAQATGSAGYNRYLRNEQIREYCRNNNKVLFDFADLDAWYNGEQSTYSYNEQDISKEHPEYNGNENVHTTYSSCENKGMALWWMLARLAGWNINENYVLDGYGGVHPGGGAQALTLPTPYFGWDIARDMELIQIGNGYYILDGYGGIHAGGPAPAISPETPYWGWDVARDIELVNTP